MNIDRETLLQRRDELQLKLRQTQEQYHLVQGALFMIEELLNPPPVQSAEPVSTPEE